jgi:hypothetical protein
MVKSSHILGGLVSGEGWNLRPALMLKYLVLVMIHEQSQDNALTSQVALSSLSP